MQCVKITTKQVVSLLAVGYLALHVGMAAPALANDNPDSARDKHDNGRCNRGSLKGTYIFTQDGFEHRRVLTTTLPDGTPTALVPADRRPFAYAGREKYDGYGHVYGINTVAQARGATANPPTPPDVLAQPVNVSGFVEYSGTYEVNSNCTAVVEVFDNPEPGEPVFVSKYHLFLSPDGEKFTFIVFSAAVVQNDVFVEDAQEITSVGVAHRVNP